MFRKNILLLLHALGNHRISIKYQDLNDNTKIRMQFGKI